jgi:hypothetical protein
MAKKSTYQRLVDLGWSAEEASWRDKKLDASQAKISRGVEECIAKNYCQIDWDFGVVVHSGIGPCNHHKGEIAEGTYAGMTAAEVLAQRDRFNEIVNG